MRIKNRKSFRIRIIEQMGMLITEIVRERESHTVHFVTTTRKKLCAQNEVLT